MSTVEFERTIPASERPQIYALDRGPLGPAIREITFRNISVHLWNFCPF